MFTLLWVRQALRTSENVDADDQLAKDDEELSNIDVIQVTVKIKDIFHPEVVLSIWEGFNL